MARTAPPVTPGASTAPAESPDTSVSDDLAKAVVGEGLKAEVATGENADLRTRLDAQEREMAEMRATIKLLARNQVATAMPEKVQLPTMKDTMAKKPDIAVLTEDGWYVPAVHPTDRLKG